MSHFKDGGHMSHHHHHHHHIVDLKWQNRVKVGTDKAKLKVKMQSVSDDADKPRVISRRKVLAPGE